MLRMRTMAEAYEEIKKDDPNTAITKSYIRRLIVSGQVPSQRAGKKYLVNMEDLETFLCNPTKKNQSKQNNYGVIRAIAE